MVADLEESCETADVASHESFWLATAAAAPVIALAAVVALPDTSGIYRNVQRTIDEWFDTPAMLSTAMLAAGVSIPVVDETMPTVDLTPIKAKVTRTTLPLRVVAAVIRWIAIANVMLQAALSAVSLVALAYSVDVMSRWLAIVLTVGGIVLLAVTVVLASDYRKAAREFSKTVAKGMPERLKAELLAVSESSQGMAEEQGSSSDDVTST